MKAYLKHFYPNHKIQNIDIAHLRKIAYAIGIGTRYGKRELIDMIYSMQDDSNPIIGVDCDGNYGIFEDVKLMKYIVRACESTKKGTD